MLIDGGYLNNVPADIIRSLGSNVIVAIDVGGSFDTIPATYGDSLSGWFALLAPIIPFFKPGKIPTQAEIQSRLTYVASVKQLNDVKNSSDVLYMHPPVVKYGVLQFEKFQEIYEAGYEYGKEFVRKWEEDGTLEDRFGVRPDAAFVKKGRTRRASI
jgi:lysophospholipid hydrolase